MTRSPSIVIVGAGLAGLMLAGRLASGRHAGQLRITVVDASARPVYKANDEVALRVSAIANGTSAALNAIGAWTHVINTRASAYERMRVWDQRDTPDNAAALRFDAAEFAVPQLGHIVENTLLLDSILRVLDNTAVKLRFATRLAAIPEADLVVGADGARSKIRELAGISTRQWPYEQTAVVTHLQPEKAHQRTALQRFLRDGPLGMLPLADGRVSVVWSTLPEKAAHAMQARHDELGEILSVASDFVLGALRVSGERGAFPLCAQHAEQYTRAGLALIGDAAHAVHPLAGQGANLGVQDALALADVIEDAMDRGRHIADLPVLRRFERARKGPNLAMLHLTTGLNRLFATDSDIVSEIRTIGMRVFNRSGPLRERAVKVALGVN